MVGSRFAAVHPSRDSQLACCPGGAVLPDRPWEARTWSRRRRTQQARHWQISCGLLPGTLFGYQRVYPQNPSFWRVAPWLPSQSADQRAFLERAVGGPSDGPPLTQTSTLSAVRALEACSSTIKCALTASPSSPGDAPCCFSSPLTARSGAGVCLRDPPEPAARPSTALLRRGALIWSAQVSSRPVICMGLGLFGHSGPSARGVGIAVSPGTRICGSAHTVFVGLS